MEATLMQTPEGVVFCAKCGTQHGLDIRFCSACGTPLQMHTSPYAGFWRRFWAFSIDYILCTILVIFLTIALSDYVSTEIIEGAIPGWATGIYSIYHAGFESSPWQATLGKMALGIKVTDKVYKRISFTRAFWRNLAMGFSFLLLGIGFLTVPFTKRKQTLHDMMSGCLVVRAHAV